MGSLMSRSFKMSNDVYAAMLARGFTGEMRTYTTYRMTRRDWLRWRRRWSLRRLAAARWATRSG